MSDYERIAGLELLVEAIELERRELQVTSGFKRVTTTVRISGGGEAGEGEDVTYEADHHDGFSPPDLSGTWTFDDLSQRLESLDLAGYRRWGFESAALDLALRQAGTSLGAAVGREYRPVRFVVSTREDIDRFLAVQPTLEFKVDPMSTWSRALIDELAATGRIRVTDLKGYYRGTVVDQPADPRLYRDVVEGFPDAVIEDAAFTDETRPILEAAADRLSFDAPIHSVEDVQALEVEPRWLNIKPSRFGSARRLLDTIAYGEEHGMTLYGGGQFELGVGRSHIQTFASCTTRTPRTTSRRASTTSRSCRRMRPRARFPRRASPRARLLALGARRAPPYPRSMAACRQCGSELPESARFCPACGTAVDARLGEERKVVTVLFADLVGSTALGDGRDPEDCARRCRPQLARMRDELEHYGGTFEKFVGDAVMAVFGAPVAHEDDPERAVRAALAIRDAVAERASLRSAVQHRRGVVSSARVRARARGS